MKKAKSTSSFVCQECGYDSPAFLGKCPECGTWNSLKEIRNVSSATTIGKPRGSGNIVPQVLSEVTFSQKERTRTGFSEFDNVLGGGIVRGAVMLVAGDPGVGKSTLLLQVALQVGTPMAPVLYISAEESAEQIKLRASRMSKAADLAHVLIVSATDTDAIMEVIESVKPALVILDSVQTIESANMDSLAGSVGQVRYGAFAAVKLAKIFGIPMLLVGHVTKEGMVAGPMILSHMVDVVLFLEGEKTTGTRILRGLKNRFGPIDEVGVFLMEEKGMVEVRHPEQVFLTQREKAVPGSVLVVTLEGTRPFLVEVQALVLPSKLPMPRRVVSGMDAKRVELLLAVLQKHARLPLGLSDVFVNIAGGLKISDPAADMGVCLALFSSFKNIPLEKTVGIAEVGLLGELRSVPFLDKRVKEAEKLGFSTIVTSKQYKYLANVIESLGNKA